MRLFWIFLGLATAFLVPFLIWGDAMNLRFGTEGARDWLIARGQWAWAGGILLLVGDLFLPIPSTAVLAALGWVYGPWWGTLIGTGGTFLSGLLAYGLCRMLGRRGALFLLGERDLERGERWFGRIGGWLVAVSRWLPLFPEIISCLAGLTRMRPGTFALALLCGCLPMSLTFVLVGHAGVEHPGLALGVSAALPPLLWLLVQRWIRRRADAPDKPADTP